MKKENELTFLSLLQDDEFLEWAKNRSITDEQVIKFMELHPDQQQTIRYAFEFAKKNVDECKTLDSAEISRMWKNILFQSEKQRRYRQRFINDLLKIAAILILILGLSFVFYWYNKPVDPLKQIAQRDVETGQDAMIVLSDGSKYNLTSKESKIEYNADGSEITVKDEKAGQEKLDNSQNTNEESIINQIVVPYGRRHDIVLSDGTKVRLNSGSRLVFSAEFKGEYREVYLKGEAFFEVAKNKERPFIVKTDHVALKVLGTSFNVSSYEDEQTITTVLVEGRVAVYQDNKLFGSSKVELHPGQGYFYSVATSSSTVKPVDIDDFVSWKDGIFRFKDQSLSNVIHRVQKYYNQAIAVEGQDLQKTVISGKLVLSDEFSNVMTYLSKTLEAHYRIKNGIAYLYK